VKIFPNLLLYHTDLLFAEKRYTSQIVSLKNAHDRMLNLSLLD